jgi:DNA-binding LacI/PurR family transcriptional regulator
MRHALGLRVPGDVSVVGFDDVPLAAAPEYDLTTLRQPINRMVAHAIRILLAEIEGAEPERIALVPELMARGSTRLGPA